MRLTRGGRRLVFVNSTLSNETRGIIYSSYEDGYDPRVLRLGNLVLDFEHTSTKMFPLQMEMSSVQVSKVLAYI